MPMRNTPPGKSQRAPIILEPCFGGGPAKSQSDSNLSQNCRLLSIRYKCRMIRLTDEQWERIRDHFLEENIADGRPGRKPIPTRCVLEAVLWIMAFETNPDRSRFR